MFYEVTRDDREVFVRPMPARLAEAKPVYETVVSMDHTDNIRGPKASHAIVAEVDEKSMMPVALDSWEDKIVWGDDDAQSLVPNNKQLARFRNVHLDANEWMDAVVFDEDEIPAQIPFHLDDPNLVVSADTLKEAAVRAEKKITNRIQFFKKRPDGKLIDRFNLSQDWLYEVTKPKRARVRQSYGPIRLQHSLPATKMHVQYAKPLLTVRELRAFHRPSIKFPLNQDFQFSKVKATKNKRIKAIDPAELMKTPKDISLKDSSKFVLVEYSEEYPMIMQNVGMASLIYNYYRKKDEKDNFVPKVNATVLLYGYVTNEFVSNQLSNGGPYILESVDASPFFGFGDVTPGQTIQTLYNNLIRAPIFPHPPPSTDFLLIRQSYQGKTKYFLREIPSLYAVGQTFPVQEVPRPQSRKITQSFRARLQVVTMRLMWRDQFRRLRYDKLRKVFTMYTDIQIRQKLKEFAQYLKKGENTGWWKLKSNMPLLEEADIQRLITPEQVCQYQSTLTGEQRLRDAGYEIEDFKELLNEEAEASMDIEIQLAPWIVTKNFVMASQGKGMVRLYGPGDPTGCGEGFSFIRASMKEMFFRAADSEEAKMSFIDAKKQATFHRYSIVEQQKVYREEIERIWQNQMRSLTAKPNEHVGGAPIGDQALDNLRTAKNLLEIEEEKERRHNYGVNSNVSSPAPYSPPAMTDGYDEFSGDERDETCSTTGSVAAIKNKVLVISRLIKNDQNQLVWKSEVVTNSRVINSYLGHRKMIEKHEDNELLINADPATLEEFRRKRIKNRTRHHVTKLQLKLGRKPTFEDILESSRPRHSEVDIMAKLAPQPASVAVPKVPEQTEDRKDDYKPTSKNIVIPVAPTKIRKRGNPSFELSTIFERIVNELMALQQAWPFFEPVSQIQFPNYYVMIQRPICFEEIKRNAKDFKYLSSEAFMDDVELIWTNCTTFNGPNHPLSQIARALVDKARRNVDSVSLKSIKSD